MNVPEIKNSEVVVFKPEGGQTEFQVVLDGEHDTVWATEQQIMDLFGKARRTIEYHIKNIYEEGELDKTSTWRDFRQVQKEGGREVSRKVSIYSLDVIISVGYRVKSQVGTEFRKWATKIHWNISEFGKKSTTQIFLLPRIRGNYTRGRR